MIRNREQLHEYLKAVIGNDHVYFQPPESLKLRYPAIVYSRSGIRNVFADDKVYEQCTEYEVIVIDKDPENEAVSRLSLQPYCRFDRQFISDNLNHSVFTIYY